MNNAYKMARSNSRSIIISALLIILIATVFGIKGGGRFEGGGTIAYQIDGEIIGIGGRGEADFIRLDDISDAEFREVLEPGEPLEKAEESRVCIGSYANAEFGEYSLFGYSDVPAFIVIRHGGGVTVFNLDSVKLTQSAFDELSEALDAIKTQS